MRAMKTTNLLLAALTLWLPACGRHKQPADIINSTAALPPGLPHDPLQWVVITSGADPRRATMGTLFGNGLAVEHARGGGRGDYPPGSILALVTWRQRDDPHWYGARIPGAVESVEFVSFDTGLGKPPSYAWYSGDPPRKAFAAPADRISEILSYKASVMP